MELEHHKESLEHWSEEEWEEEEVIIYIPSIYSLIYIFFVFQYFFRGQRRASQLIIHIYICYINIYIVYIFLDAQLLEVGLTGRLKSLIPGQHKPECTRSGLH